MLNSPGRWLSLACGWSIPDPVNRKAEARSNGFSAPFAAGFALN
jgi:hypothetical protein